MKAYPVKVSQKAFDEITRLSEASKWTKGDVIDWLIILAKQSPNFGYITISTTSTNEANPADVKAQG